MGSDRARISYDKRREYRSVVTQQGRVTLEADWNEDRQIAAELLREETLDFVGPCGTPDDGFLIEAPTGETSANDLQIKAGTMYVGGERVVLESDLLYSDQPSWEWLDSAQDPAWVDAGEIDSGQRELVYLYLEEHEVGAVEDTALLEVALGGPDTAERLRLLQRVVRHATDASTCADATGELVDSLGQLGLMRDPKTQRLTSAATLQVEYQDPGTPDTLCEPGAQGGYLGAENQLIRIQTTGLEQDGRQTLVWGYDNASFLYRVEVGSDLQTLTLASSPVDDFHKPRSGQTVEVLRSAAQLHSGTDTTDEASAGDVVAAATGQLFTLAADYDSTTKQVQLSGTLTADFAPPAPAGDAVPPAPSPVFLRVWEDQVAFAPDTPTELGNTGVSVILHTGDLPFHAGDFWQVAVRPKTPAKIYPLRYLDQGQPPDGPRLWLTPLAVIEWGPDGFEMLEDCRAHFDNLVELSKERCSGCCDIAVHPEDLDGETTLQSIVDRFQNSPATICLAAGTYSLPEPLRLVAANSELTIEACHGPAVLQAEEGSDVAFYDGLVVLVGANDVTLRGIQFRLPQSPIGAPKRKLPNSVLVDVRNRALGARLPRTNVSIGVRALHCANLAVEDCDFVFTADAGQDVFGAGIFSGSDCRGFAARGNRFYPDAGVAHEAGAARVLVGYLLSPANIEEEAGSGRGGSGKTGMTGFLPSLLDDATLRDNSFTGLSAAALVYADCGLVRVEDNTVRQCELGFVFLSLRAFAAGAIAKDELEKGAMGSARSMVLSSLVALVEDPVVALAGLHAGSFTIPIWATKLLAPAVATGAVKAADAAKVVKAVTDAAEAAFAAQPAGTFDALRARTTTSADLSNAELASFLPSKTVLAPGVREIISKYLLGSGLALNLHFGENDLDLRNASAEPGASLPEPGPGLVVWDVDAETGSTLTMAGNRIATGTPLAAVAVYLVERCAVAANVVQNDGDERPVSLLFVPLANQKTDATISVAGNSLRGRTILPARPAQPDLTDWDAFNAVTP